MPTCARNTEGIDIPLEPSTLESAFGQATVPIGLPYLTPNVVTIEAMLARQASSGEAGDTTTTTTTAGVLSGYTLNLGAPF
eukprot:7671025-Pyramimonas_sp.AAC.1